MAHLGVWLTGVALVGLGGALGWWLRPSAPVREAPDAHAHDQSEQVAALTRQVRDLQARTLLRPEAPAAPVPSVSATSAAPNAMPRMTREERWQRLDDRLETEPRDASWARATEQRITEELAFGPDSSAKLETVQCGSTLCKLEVSMKSENEAPALIDLIQDKTPFLPHGSMRKVAMPDGTTRILTYAALEGHPLDPPVEAAP